MKGNHIKPRRIGRDMIGAEIKSQEKRRAKHSAKYAAGENEQEKVLAYGHMNCFAETFEDAVTELDADDLAYSGSSDDNVAHWVFSVHADEILTPAMAEEFIENFLEDQGMKGHKCAWGLHQNTENLHIHLTFLRTKPEPEPSGKYKIQNYGGRVKWANGTNNRYECSRATILDFCKKYGLKDDFTEVAAKPGSDAIRLSQKIQAGEAQTGQKHPKRLIAEQARDIIRSAKSWNEMHDGLIKHGISFHIKDGWTGDKYWQGAVLKGPEGEKIPLSLMPKDCRLYALEKRFGEQGRGSGEAPKTEAGKAFYTAKLSANAAKSQARKIFNAAGSMEEAEKLLGEKGMRLERQGKNGCYLRYGEADDQKMKLSALGGKYSLFALSKKYNGQGSNDNATMHGSQGKVNASSMQSASKYADRANDRASSAAERAVSVAAEGVQAKTLAEALDDAFAQAVALDQVRKANRVAAVAQERLGKMEIRAETAERALVEGQHMEITVKTEKEKKMESHFDHKLEQHQARIKNAGSAIVAAVRDIQRAAVADRAQAREMLQDLRGGIDQFVALVRGGQEFNWSQADIESKIPAEQHVANYYSPKAPGQYNEVNEIADKLRDAVWSNPPAVESLTGLHEVLEMSVNALPWQKD